MFTENYFFNFAKSIDLVCRNKKSIPIIFLDRPGHKKDLLNYKEVKFLKQVGFKGMVGERAILPKLDGSIGKVFLGFGTTNGFVLERFVLGAIISSLPENTYSIDEVPKKIDLEELLLGYFFSKYKFSYKKSNEIKILELKNLSENTLNFVGMKTIKPYVESEWIMRDLTNMPASHLGPDKFDEAILKFAKFHSMSFSAYRGKELLENNFPLIHVVGRASKEIPRLLDLSWGSRNSKKVTLVGKGVCFDTGGLNLKSSPSMNIMKKDMGGAANVLALAHLIISNSLDIRLRVIIPIVENSISALSFRPGDVLVSRKGLTIEVNNTDAEGRLILADALAFASEETPEILISMATLTGAARVALGPDIAPFFSTERMFSNLIKKGGLAKYDPVWELPFHEPYEGMIISEIADLDNAPSGPFGGALTAALFLKRFVSPESIFSHFDIYAWSPENKPGRSKGAVSQGIRALYYAIKNRLKIK